MNFARFILSFAACGLVSSHACIAAPMTVVEARGGGLRPGMRVDSAAKIQL